MSTELEAAHRRIEQLQRQLAQTRLEMEDFTYSVSHDLRASLRHVGSYLKIVREDLGESINPEIAAHLDTAQDAAARMSVQMDGLLELSRVGRAEMQFSDVDLFRLVSDLVHRLDAQPHERRI